MPDTQLDDTTTPSTINPIDRRRHFLAVFFLSFLWGTFGVDRFYLGKVATGILKLLSFGGLGLWVIIDMVLIMSGAMTDKQGQPMREFERYKKFAIKTVLIFAVATGVVTLITGGVAIYLITQAVTTMMEQGPGGLENLLPTGISPTDMQSLEGLN